MANPKFMGKTIKGTKEHLLKKIYYLMLGDMFFFALIGIAVGPKFWERLKEPNLIVYSAIGLLTFIAIFYSLVFSDSAKKKLSELRKRIEEYAKDVEEVFQNKKNSTKDIDELSKEIKKLRSEVSNVKILKILIQIDKILYLTVVCFILSIVFYSISNLLILPSVLFITGVVLVFHIITAWVFVFQDEYNIETVNKSINSVSYIKNIKTQKLYP